MTLWWFAYSVILVITRKWLSELLFRKFMSRMTDHDVISSNLVLFVWKLYRSLLQTFLNVWKSLSDHTKNSLLNCWSQLSFIWHRNGLRNDEYMCKHVRKFLLKLRAVSEKLAKTTVGYCFDSSVGPYLGIPRPKHQKSINVLFSPYTWHLCK